MHTLLLCVILSAPPTATPHSLTVNGTMRSYLLYIPTTVVGKEVPFVLAFHGKGEEATAFERDSELTDFAESKGFVVAYPAGINLQWNAGPSAFGSADDRRFVADLLADIPKYAKFDSKRVYAVGMSNGGMMAYRLAAEMSDVFSAIMVVSGSLETAPASITKPVSVLHVHGTADIIVPFDGKPIEPSVSFKPAHATEDAIQIWVKQNGCDTSKMTKTILSADPANTVTRYDYPPTTPASTGSDASEVSLVVVANGGHLWPGGKMPTEPKPLLPFLGTTTSKVHANDLMWDFFQRHHR